MATAPKMPPADNEVLEILRRLEPALVGITGRLDKMDGRLEKMDERLRAVEGEVRELKGRVTQLPTLWTLASLVVAIFAFAFLLLRFAAPAAHP